MIRMFLLGLGFVAITAALLIFQPGVPRLSAQRSAPEPVTRSEPVAIVAPVPQVRAADPVRAPLRVSSGFTPATAIAPIALAPVARTSADFGDEEMRRMTWNALSDLNHATGRDSAPGQPGSLLHTIVQRSLDSGTLANSRGGARAISALAVQPGIYVVQSGDSLVSIAERVYGDVNMTGPLFAANQSLLKRPDDLRPGQNLILPEK